MSGAGRGGRGVPGRARRPLHRLAPALAPCVVPPAAPAECTRRLLWAFASPVAPVLHCVDSPAASAGPRAAVAGPRASGAGMGYPTESRGLQGAAASRGGRLASKRAPGATVAARHLPAAAPMQRPDGPVWTSLAAPDPLG